MKQSIFYRCMMSGDEMYALHTLGYTEGGIGLVKDTKQRGWVATHIPTGGKITPNASKHKTARSALLEAESAIIKADNVLEAVQKVRNTKGYDKFIADRDRQIKKHLGECL